MEYREHVTTEGERWDTLAAVYYGDPYRYEPIIRANPNVPVFQVFPAGILLRVPVLEASTSSLEDLPPWKR